MSNLEVLFFCHRPTILHTLQHFTCLLLVLTSLVSNFLFLLLMSDLLNSYVVSSSVLSSPSPQSCPFFPLATCPSPPTLSCLYPSVYVCPSSPPLSCRFLPLAACPSLHPVCPSLPPKSCPSPPPPRPHCLSFLIPSVPFSSSVCLASAHSFLSLCLSHNCVPVCPSPPPESSLSHLLLSVSQFSLCPVLLSPADCLSLFLSFV